MEKTFEQPCDEYLPTKIPARLFGHFDANAITADRIVQYQKERRQLGRQPRTVNSETATLRQVLDWVKNRDMIDFVPDIETIPHLQPRLEFPSPQEVSLILNSLGVGVTALIVLAVTGV